MLHLLRMKSFMKRKFIHKIEIWQKMEKKEKYTQCNAYCQKLTKTLQNNILSGPYVEMNWVPKVRWPPRGRAGGLLTQRRTKTSYASRDPLNSSTLVGPAFSVLSTKRSLIYVPNGCDGRIRAQTFGPPSYTVTGISSHGGPRCV